MTKNTPNSRKPHYHAQANSSRIEEKKNSEEKWPFTMPNTYLFAYLCTFSNNLWGKISHVEEIKRISQMLKNTKKGHVLG